MTGVGAFIDFYLGPPGRLRAKDWMLKWWLKIDDVARSNETPGFHA
jgi:hypothetical protein